MKITTQELEKMRTVDIGAVDADTLPDVSGMAFHNGLSPEERITRFMQAGGNPACYFETKCPEAEASLLSSRNRGII